MSFDRLRAKLIITFILISSVPLIFFAVVYRKEAELVGKSSITPGDHRGSKHSHG